MILLLYHLGNLLGNGRWRPLVVRAGTLTCVAVVLVLCALRLDEALGLYDQRADENAAQGYLDRLYGEPFNIIGSRRVIVDALLRIPPDSEYRVVRGAARLRVGRPDVTRELGPEFARYILLPRRQTDSSGADWILCYGCARPEIGPEYVIVSDGGNGILLAQRIR